MRDLSGLKDFVTLKVDPKRAARDLDWPTKGNIPCPMAGTRRHPGTDSNPSFTVLTHKPAPRSSGHRSALGYCHACRFIVGDVLDLVAVKEGEPGRMQFKDALRAAYHEWVRPLVPDRAVARSHKALMEREDLLRRLSRERGISKRVASRHRLGYSEGRITIPIVNRWGLVEDLLRWDWEHTSPKYKFLPYKEGHGGVRLWPLEELAHRTVVLCEGQPDTLCALSAGLPALTAGGTSSWDDDFSELFRGKRVWICYDADKPGKEAAQERAAALYGQAERVRVVELPLRGTKDDKDLTDWFVRGGGSTKALNTLAARTPYWTPPAGRAPAEDARPRGDEKLEGGEALKVDLLRATSPALYGRKVATHCLVSGRDLQPFLVPESVEARCWINRGKLCVGCHMNDAGGRRTFTFSPWNGGILTLTGVSETQLKGALRKLCDIPEACRFEVTNQKMRAIEMVRLIPALDRGVGRKESAEGRAGCYAVRTGFVVGGSVEANRTYRFTGYSTPNPRDQRGVLVTPEVAPSKDTVEAFKLTPGLHKDLRRVFGRTGDPWDMLLGRADALAHEVTKIKGQPHIHIAVDLAFHSVQGFTLMGERVLNGMLDVLILGDSRVGKGQCGEGLVRWYDLGEVIPGQNCTQAGLIGGMDKIGDHWFVAWGAWPLHNLGLVVMDEFPGQELTWKLSRARSEGVAEITKIGHTERTRALVRKIWLTNPLYGTVGDYKHGVEAIQDLVGSAEDVARFDLALVVRRGEVPLRAINRPMARRENPYPRELCRALILWAWSRSPAQVAFAAGTTERITRASLRLAQRFDPAVPLIQGENVRVKLAKVSAAVAAMGYSASEDGERLVVMPAHVAAAVRVFEQFYTRPAMAYDRYSEIVRKRQTLKSEGEARRLLRTFGRFRRDFTEGMLETRRITLRSLQSWTGSDREGAHRVADSLIRLRAIEDKGGWFETRPAFVDFLRARNGVTAGVGRRGEEEA